MKLRTVPLGRLNSATKYPSIPLYHEMGDGGRLTDKVAVPFDEGDELRVTEKIDGANGRIILFPDGAYVIGSREELLYARGDLIHNPQLGIVDGVREFADRIAREEHHFPDHVLVLYLEVYGGNIGKNAKQYTGNRHVGFRLFDLVRFELEELADLVFAHDREEIARWRKHGGQPLVDVDALEGYAAVLEVDLVPRLEWTSALPTSHEATLEWLNCTLPERRTQALLDVDARGRAEGVVVRTPDRSKIAKMRFDTYHRTLTKG